MKRKIFPIFLMNGILLLFVLMLTGCEGIGVTDDKQNLPYDYDEAVAKLNEHCRHFPTSFGIVEEDDVFLYDVTGVVISESQFYPEEHEARFGLLTFEEGKLGMDEFDEDSSEYDHAKELFEALSLEI